MIGKGKYLIGCGLAALIFVAAPEGRSAVAAPLPSSTAALQDAVPGTVSPARWRGHGHRHHRGWRGGGVAAGLAAGTILGLGLGAAAASAARPDYYYSPHYYSDAPVYGPPAGRCWVPTDRDRGFGYWAPC